jgi:hypothetical protein
MCYSVESSAKTSLLAFTSIVILFSSNVPHFKWIALTMAGWCSIQVAELMLWLTNPRKSCTLMNKLITLTVIPLFLLSQPIFATIGSFFVKPWSKCSINRKIFIVVYCAISGISFLYSFYNNPKKYCTTVTPKGHLHWYLNNRIDTILENPWQYYFWLVGIAVPLYLLWDVSYKALFVLLLLPLFGFFYALRTDSKASLWCYYSSFSAIVMVIVYGLYKFKIYNILK